MDRIIDMLNEEKNITINFREIEPLKTVKEIEPKDLKRELENLKEGESLIVRF